MVDFSLFLVSCCIVILFHSVIAVNECEKKAHSSLNPSQRAELCELAPHELGPAVCSVAAKNSLRLKADDILSLCQGAHSAAPAECMTKLDTTNRAKVGVALCASAETSLPAECYTSLMFLSKHGSSTQSAGESIVSFCNALEDSSAMHCAEAALKHTQVGLAKALLICSDSTPSDDPHVVQQCVESMSSHVQPSAGLTAEKALKFCTEINLSIYNIEHGISPQPLAAVNCFKDSFKLLTKHSLTATQRLSLCSNAALAHGPINCTLSIQEQREPLIVDQVVSLCSRAQGKGPALCLGEARGLGSIYERIQLCNAAKSAGPAHCYRRAAAVFRQEQVQQRLLLCVNAQSEGPAACAAAAPHYLTAEEKVQLCAGASSSNSNSASKCLQVVQSLSARHAAAPKKALGYFIENLLSPSDIRSRALLVQLCAFSDSQDPLASAECFKAVPNSVEHDQAALMCRNISSQEVVEHVLLCYRILPRPWTALLDSSSGNSPDLAPAHMLCQNAGSRAQTEAVVNCAVQAGHLAADSVSGDAAVLKLAQQEIASVCRTETHKAYVLSCLRQIYQPSFLQAFRSGYLQLNNHTVHHLCADAEQYQAQCLPAVATQLQQQQQRLTLSSDALVDLCRSSQPAQGLLICLSSLRKKLSTTEDVHKCEQTPRTLTQVRLESAHTNASALQANERFHLFFGLYDQYGARFDDPSHLYSLSLRPNPHGAVLWGIRSNRSSAGVLSFHSLSVTQPGSVELHLNLHNRTVYLFKLQVQENPLYAGLTHCLFVFSGQCGISDNEMDVDAFFPLRRGFLAHTHYLQQLHCLDKLSLWQVDGHLLPSGAMLLDYKIGIDAIWTGLGMPQQEQDMHTRLGLPKGQQQDKEGFKRVRRAYYKASLQWHPDRWAGYDQYAETAQATFQLVHEAYESLLQEYTAAGAAAAAGARSADPVFA